MEKQSFESVLGSRKKVNFEQKTGKKKKQKNYFDRYLGNPGVFSFMMLNKAYTISPQ